MSRILILANDETTIYNFRRELIAGLIEDHHDVYVCFPRGGEKTDAIIGLGCNFVEITLERKGKNFFKELSLIHTYQKLIKSISPDVVLTFTVKPNIYGGIAASHLNIPTIANITGLGVISQKGILQKMLMYLQKIAFKKAKCVFFQNQSNLDFYRKNKVVSGCEKLIPGSGVNTTLHCFEDYPDRDKKISFITVSRIIKEKGYSELFEAAKIACTHRDDIEFHVVGWYEDENYKEIIEDLSQKGVVIYHGSQPQEIVHELISQAHCMIHPSYYPEGLSNVLLEAEACGRPVITTDNPGCKETVEEGNTGYVIPMRDTNALVGAILRFADLPYEEKKKMGIAARKMVEKKFDRNLVIAAYKKEISEIMK